MTTIHNEKGLTLPELIKESLGMFRCLNSNEITLKIRQIKGFETTREWEIEQICNSMLRKRELKEVGEFKTITYKLR